MVMPITTRGQVTIHKRIRDQIGLVQRSRVELALDAMGQVVQQKAGTPNESRFSRFRRNTLITKEIRKLTQGKEWGDGTCDAG